jgi:hypothetical protein
MIREYLRFCLVQSLFASRGLDLRGSVVPSHKIRYQSQGDRQRKVAKYQPQDGRQLSGPILRLSSLDLPKRDMTGYDRDTRREYRGEAGNDRRERQDAQNETDNRQRRTWSTRRETCRCGSGRVGVGSCVGRCQDTLRLHRRTAATAHELTTASTERKYRHEEEGEPGPTTYDRTSGRGLANRAMEISR